MIASAMMSFNEIEINDVILPRDQHNATNVVREFIKVGTCITSIIGIIDAHYSVGVITRVISAKHAKGKLFKHTESKTYFQHALIKVLKQI